MMSALEWAAHSASIEQGGRRKGGAIALLQLIAMGHRYYKDGVETTEEIREVA
jgi:hypothetical protein